MNINLDDMKAYVQTEIALHISLETQGAYPSDIQKNRNSAFRRLRDAAFEKLKGNQQ